MANSDKNIRIQPNRNSALFPKITFTGQSNNPITLNVLDDNSISFEGSSGQLFAINNNLSSGYIFSVNDISGLPSFRINADGTVGIAEYYGNVGIGVTNPLYKFHARGDSYFSSIGNTALLLISGAGGTIIASNSVNITLTDPARKGLVISAATSQSANLLEWYADGGVGLGYALAGTIRPTGQLHLGSPGLTMSNGGSALLGLQGRGSSEGLAIRGYNSNLNNPLFEVQGNAGNQLFGIYGDGGVNAPRINVINTTGSTSTSSGALIVSGGVGIGGSVNIGKQLTVTETTRLNSSIFNNPPTSSIGGSLISSGAIWGSFWTGYQVENGYLIYGRQVSGGSIIIAEPLTGTQVGGTGNVFAEALKHFKWGNDKYVVLASTGNSVLYSTSPVGAGSSWYYATLPTSASWQKLEYGNNRFIAIATGSTSAYSLDGINWTLSTLPGSYTWSDIKHGNGVFVAGAGNTVAYTYDGIEWTIASNNVNSTFITFGNGLFFANSSSNTASYSSDGITWTNTTLPSDTHRGTVYGNGVFYNIGASSSNYISSDLINWTAIPGGVGTLSVPNAPWYVNNTFNQNQPAGSFGSISSGPTGTLDFSPRFTGEINNVRIGAVTPGSAEFTSLAAVGPVRFVSNIASTNYKSGSVVITGGVGIGQTLFTSPSFANSLSGVVLNNGVITTATWAGSTITGLYGGTGHTNYIKGDLLVGAGNTIIKLPSGNDSFVLIANSSQTSGLAWTAASSIASTTIGNPNDGLYSDGFFNAWTNSTTIANAFDDVNELLSLIAPARPGYLTGTSLSAGSVPTFYTVGISAGLGTEWYQAGYGTNSSITRYYISSTPITLNTANTSSIFSAGSLTTSTYGTINFKRFNSSNPSGASYGTIDLSTNYTVGYTNNNLKLTALGTYNSIWTKANAQILSYSQTTPGYEGYTIAHTENNQETSIYEVWRDPWTQANPNPIHAQAATASTNAQNLKYLSGIGYYTTGTGFSVYFKGAAGIFSSCYNTTQIYAISATGLATATGTTSSPLYSGELDKTGPNHVRVTLNSANASSFNKYLTVTLYKAGGGTSNSNAIISRAINTYSTTSTTTFDGFQDEAFRLVIGSGIAFTSTIDMANGNAQVRSGSLTYPLAADYDTEYGGSHSFTGDQEYQRYFYKTSASTGSLTFGGFTASNVAAYGTGNLNVLAYLEGDNKWFDLGVQQGSNANDGSSRAAAISAKTSTSSGTLNWSFGVYSTGVAGAGNSARYRVVIIFRNNTYSMTSIASI